MTTSTYTRYLKMSNSQKQKIEWCLPETSRTGKWKVAIQHL